MWFENSRSRPNDLHLTSRSRLLDKAVPSSRQINDSSIEFGYYFKDDEKNMAITMSQFASCGTVN
jgi:hypothetical protein